MRTWKFYCQKLEAQTTACRLVARDLAVGKNRRARSAYAFAHEIRLDIAAQETDVAESLPIEVEMRFSKIVFWVAGIWGLLVITPLFFIFNLIGRQDPPPITHPGFYYGFTTAALAWQIAFLVIAQDPVRFHPLMIPSVVEKFGYGIVVLILFLQSRMRVGDLVLGSVDLLLGVLFIAAFLKTGTMRETISRGDARQIP
jgi:hypothetical protein